VQKNRRYELYRSELVMFSVQPFAPHIPGNCDDILTHPPQVILTVLRRQIGTESPIRYVRERHVEFFPCVFAAFKLYAVPRACPPIFLVNSLLATESFYLPAAIRSVEPVFHLRTVPRFSGSAGQDVSAIRSRNDGSATQTRSLLRDRVAF
jgi:hypothetical protein